MIDSDQKLLRGVLACAIMAASAYAFWQYVQWRDGRYNAAYQLSFTIEDAISRHLRSTGAPYVRNAADVEAIMDDRVPSHRQFVHSLITSQQRRESYSGYWVKMNPTPATQPTDVLFVLERFHRDGASSRGITATGDPIDIPIDP